MTFFLQQVFTPDLIFQFFLSYKNKAITISIRERTVSDRNKFHFYQSRLWRNALHYKRDIPHCCLHYQ